MGLLSPEPGSPGSMTGTSGIESLTSGQPQLVHEPLRLLLRDLCQPLATTYPKITAKHVIYDYARHAKTIPVTLRGQKRSDALMERISAQL